MYLVDEFFAAALELKQFDWAEYFLRVVRCQFPKSIKVTRMLAMYHEAHGDAAKASTIYLDLISAEPTDAVSVKRLVALFRDMGVQNEALQILTKYLEVNQEDMEGW